MTHDAQSAGGGSSALPPVPATPTEALAPAAPEVVLYRVPANDVAGDPPSEETCEWLSRCPVDWDGDNFGITIGEDFVGPGGYVISVDGEYKAVPEYDILQYMDGAMVRVMR